MLFPCRVEDDRRDPTDSGGRVLRGWCSRAGRPECRTIGQTEQMAEPRTTAWNPPLLSIRQSSLILGQKAPKIGGQMDLVSYAMDSRYPGASSSVPLINFPESTFRVSRGLEVTSATYGGKTANSICPLTPASPLS